MVESWTPAFAGVTCRFFAGFAWSISSSSHILQVGFGVVHTLIRIHGKENAWLPDRLARISGETGERIIEVPSLIFICKKRKWNANKNSFFFVPSV